MKETKEALQKRAIKVISILADRERATMLGEFRRRKISPFQMLITTILSARAKDETTMPISDQLFSFYPTPEKLAIADPEHVKKIIKKIGFYNNKTKNIIACAQKLLDEYHGKVPGMIEKLIELPGVGRKVANCVLVYAFGKDAIPVDTHVHRISNRLGFCKTKDPEKTEAVLEKLFPQKYWRFINDTLVHHGKTICQPLVPYCSKCPVEKLCSKVGVKKRK